MKTPSARSKIKRYFTAVTKDDDAAAGGDILSKELRKRGYGISTARSTRALHTVCDQLNYRQLEDLFAAIGSGKVACRMVGNRVEQILDPEAGGSRKDRCGAAGGGAARARFEPPAARPQAR